MARKTTQQPHAEIEPAVLDADAEEAAPVPLMAGTFALYETDGSYIAAVWSEETGDVVRAIPKRLLAMLAKSPQLKKMLGG
jgi:hypothetical protein